MLVSISCWVCPPETMWESNTLDVTVIVVPPLQHCSNLLSQKRLFLWVVYIVYPHGNLCSSIVCIGVSTPLPLKSSNYPSPSLFLVNSPLYIGFFENPPSYKSHFSVNPQYNSFWSIIPSYILKVTKFLGKISQFEFLVMTEKNIFAYKLFFVIKYFRFQFIYFCKNCNCFPVKTTNFLKTIILKNICERLLLNII